MPDDKKAKKPSAKPKGPPGAGGPPGMGAGPPPPPDPMGAMPPDAMGPPGAGAPPPMPGQGIDPYAALMGQVSSSPMGPQDVTGGGMAGMPPMGGGPPGMPPGMPPDMMGGGMPPMGGPPMGGGMPPDMMGGGMPPMGGGGMPPMGGGNPMGAGMDPITAALMSDINPAQSDPRMPENVFNPGPEQMSLNKILEMLSLIQGGIPSSGLSPGGPSNSGMAGMKPVPGALG